MRKILVFLFMSMSSPTSKIVKLEDYYYLGGESIGIVMHGEVQVNKMYSVNGEKPWNKSYMEVGSTIKKINNEDVKTIDEVRRKVMSSNGETLYFTYSTNDVLYDSEIKPVKVNNQYTIGLDIKDKLEGVGTLTYIDQNLNYGALGHVIKTNFKEGIVTPSSVTKIRKSEPGMPGYKSASLRNVSLGNVTTNDFTGIFGKLDNLDILTREVKLKVGSKDDVKVGKAEIFTVIEKDKVEKFSINILALEKQETKDIKSMLIEVTDARLLEETGGIVQGMSGSPIVQNGKIIGAVTHVLIDNPKTGYGIYIDWMLK